MSLPVYPDGCIIPNIPTRLYLVTMVPRCGHRRLRGSVIAVMAESVADAVDYVNSNASLGMHALSAELAPERGLGATVLPW
jgi:hypothetical protein